MVVMSPTVVIAVMILSTAKIRMVVMVTAIVKYVQSTVKIMM